MCRTKYCYVLFIIFLETAVHLIKHTNIKVPGCALFSTTEHVFAHHTHYTAKCWFECTGSHGKSSMMSRFIQNKISFNIATIKLKINIV